MQIVKHTTLAVLLGLWQTIAHANQGSVRHINPRQAHSKHINFKHHEDGGGKRNPAENGTAKVVAFMPSHISPRHHVAPRILPNSQGPSAFSSYWITGYDDRGLTATGTQARSGEIAVDPMVIPLGSWVQIQGYDGLFHAEDTGGAIRGRRVDIWFPTVSQCYSSTGWRMVRWARNQSDFSVGESLKEGSNGSKN